MSLRLRFEHNGRPFQMPMSQSDKYLAFFSMPEGLAVVSVRQAVPGQGPVGYWLIPQSVLEDKLQTLRPVARAKIAAEKAWRQAMLAKFDLNNNGILDPVELAAMHLDPACLEHDRTEIDLDQNGFLDVDELPYFDVTQKSVIGKKEREAIRLFNAILAKKALETFDKDHNGKLDSDEWKAFFESSQLSLAFQKILKTPETAMVFSGSLSVFDRNGDGALDADEVAAFMERRFDALDLAAYEYSLAPEKKGANKP